MSTSTPEPTPAVADGALTGPFDGLTVIITGDIDGWTRDIVHAAITKMGGKPVSSVSGKTGLVIMGEGAGVSKMNKTRTHDLDVIDAEGFVALADAFRTGTWDGKRVGEPVSVYDARTTEPEPEPDPVLAIPFDERHKVAKGTNYPKNPAGRTVREVRQFCSCGHRWLASVLEGEDCPVEAGHCDLDEIAPWERPGYIPVWPPHRDYEMPVYPPPGVAPTLAQQVAAQRKTTPAAPAEPVPAPTALPEAPAPAAPVALPEPTPDPVVTALPEVVEETPAPAATTVASAAPADPFDDDWSSHWDDVAYSFDGTLEGGYASDPDFTEPTPAPEPVEPAPAPVLSFRRLSPADTRAVMDLSADVWWMAERDERLVMSLLSTTAMQIHGLFEATASEAAAGGEGRLVATASLLTDGLTKAVLVDVVVATDCRGRGLGDEVVARTMSTVPDHIEGILYCRAELTGLYADHGFKQDDSYALMLRR